VNTTRVRQGDAAAGGLALFANFLLDGDDEQIPVQQRGDGGLLRNSIQGIADFTSLPDSRAIYVNEGIDIYRLALRSERANAEPANRAALPALSAFQNLVQVLDRHLGKELKEKMMDDRETKGPVDVS